MLEPVIDAGQLLCLKALLVPLPASQVDDASGTAHCRPHLTCTCSALVSQTPAVSLGYCLDLYGRIPGTGAYRSKITHAGKS
jgi:hypothetical protein